MARYTPIVGRDDLRGALAEALSGRLRRPGNAGPGRDHGGLQPGLLPRAHGACRAGRRGDPGCALLLQLPDVAGDAGRLARLPSLPPGARRRAGPGGRTRKDHAAHPGHRAGDAQQPHRRHIPAGDRSTASIAWRARPAWRWCSTRPTATSCRATARPTACSRSSDWDETLVHLYSFSKVYSLTGYRVGALVAGSGLLAEVAKAADCVAICAPAIAQEAALYGLNHLADFRAEKRRLVLERVAQFRAVFEREDLAYELICAGAFFAYVRHPFAGTPAVDVAHRLIQEENVLCLPGSAFGPDQDDYLRFALANIDGDAMAALGDRLVASQG